MVAYRYTELRRVARALRMEINAVTQAVAQLENAALWYRLARRRPERTPPSKNRAKLKQIAATSRRLLHQLGISDVGEADDGPADMEILESLAPRGQQQTETSERLWSPEVATDD